MTAPDRYVAEILREFRELPGTSGRTGPADRRLARSLYDTQIPLDVVRAALLLATARRLVRATSDTHPIPVVRSLAYFRHTIDEVLHCPLDPAYFVYVRRTLRGARPAPNAASNPA